MVSASEGAFAGDETTFIDAMKEKARELGGDALLLSQLGTSTQGFIQLGSGLLGAAEEKNQSATIIRFKNSDCKE